MTVHTNNLQNKLFNPRKLKWGHSLKGNVCKMGAAASGTTLNISPMTKPRKDNL